MPDPRDASPMIRASITLPANLVREVDRAAGARGRSRFIAEATARRLRLDEQARALRASEAALANPDEPFDPLALADWLDQVRRPRT